MRTPDCSVASNPALALVTDALRAQWHARCPGWYVNVATGAHERCDCPCHAQEVPLPPADARRLPLLRPPPAPVPSSATGEPKEGPQRRTSRPVTLGSAPPPGGGGACEHCGRPCNGRFVVGHDQKLKGELIRLAGDGDVAAAAELVQRDWMRLVKPGRVRQAIVEQAATLAQDQPGLTAAHIESRSERWKEGHDPH